MGASQSTHTTPEIKDVPKPSMSRSVSGRKQSNAPEKQEDEPRLISPIDSDEDSSVSSEDESAEEDDYEHGASQDDVEEEEDEEWNERLAVLRDARLLKQWANIYAHPEAPVYVDPLSKARNFFGRASAPQPDAEDEEHERIRVLADAAELKQLAVDYLHPERPVETTDAFACGRNYFSRPSAEFAEDEAERQQILEEAAELKQLAVDYLHPERPVETTDAFACGRNYFDRPSAPGHEEHIHSQSAFDHDEHVYHDHHGYHYADGIHHYHHHDDISHGHSDHFDMDGDFSDEFTHFRQSLMEIEPFKGDHPQEVAEGNGNGNGQEGKLSRSPSTVMLFDAGMVN